MNATCRFALIAFTLAASSASAQDVKGWFSEDGDGATSLHEAGPAKQ